MAKICSQCGKPPVEPRKGLTLHYYRGSQEESYYVCGTACADALKAKKKAEETPSDAEKRGYGRKWKDLGIGALGAANRSV